MQKTWIFFKLIATFLLVLISDRRPNSFLKFRIKNPKNLNYTFSFNFTVWWYQIMDLALIFWSWCCNRHFHSFKINNRIFDNACEEHLPCFRISFLRNLFKYIDLVISALAANVFIIIILTWNFLITALVSHIAWQSNKTCIGILTIICSLGATVVWAGEISYENNIDCHRCFDVIFGCIVHIHQMHAY